MDYACSMNCTCDDGNFSSIHSHLPCKTTLFIIFSVEFKIKLTQNGGSHSILIRCSGLMWIGDFYGFISNKLHDIFVTCPCGAFSLACKASFYLYLHMWCMKGLHICLTNLEIYIHIIKKYIHLAKFEPQSFFFIL